MNDTGKASKNSNEIYESGLLEPSSLTDTHSAPTRPFVGVR